MQTCQHELNTSKEEVQRLERQSRQQQLEEEEKVGVHVSFAEAS
jgi:hypothetical protein